VLLGLETFLFAECWVGHQRPLNSTQSRDSSVPEIPDGKTLTVVILDESGNPIPKARFSYFGDPKPHHKSEYQHYVETDDRGQFVVRFKPKTVQKMFQIEVDHSGYAPYNATWENPQTDPIPETYTIKLEKAVQVGGIIVDETGKPSANADIEFCIHWENRSRTPQICSYRVWVKTDENGVWTCNLIPKKMLNRDVHFFVDIKDYMPFEQTIRLSEFLPDTNGTFKHTATLDRGHTLKGRVTDTDGKPIKNATIFANYQTTRNDFVAKTNENGEYVISNLPPSNDAYIGVWSAGKMSTIKEFTISKNNVPTIDVVMKPAGKPIKIKIVDKEGKPVSGFLIALERWGKHRLVNEILLTGKPNRPHTGADGCWTWNEAPENEEVIFDMFNDNSMSIRNKSMTAQNEEYVFTASPSLQISGKITDAETGQPIPAFKVYLGLGHENSTELYWDFRMNSGKDGEYAVHENFPRHHFSVKIEADGYEPAISRNIEPNEDAITIDFVMKKMSAEKLANTLKGTVLTPHGKPAANAEVVMITPKHRFIATDGRIRGNKPFVVKTDNNGKFQFAWIDFNKERDEYAAAMNVKMDDYALYIIDTSGFKQITQQEMENIFNQKPITLEKWGRIEGTVKIGTKPADKIIVKYRYMNSDKISPSSNLIPYWEISAKSDENGNFFLEQIPPGSGEISRSVTNSWDTNARMELSVDENHVNVLSGETVTVQVGGGGRPVIGKVVTEKSMENVNFEFCYVNCEPLPQTFFSEITSWFSASTGSKQRTKNNTSRQLGFVLEDGTFRLEHITEGDWQLSVNLSPPPERVTIAHATHRFKIKNIPNGVSDEPFDLGILTLEKIKQPKPLLQVGQIAPDFEIPQVFPIAENAEKSSTQKSETKIKLSDYKGKFVILDFWATWCVPCIATLPELRKFYETIHGDPRFVMIGISFDNSNSAEMVGKFIAQKEMKWLHGLAGRWEDSPILRDYNIKSIPSILLIGEDGKVILLNPTIENLVQKINELKK
jgi:uncharacterized GH25 family protein/thiol-disulfide isomerase/thioredoxin